MMNMNGNALQPVETGDEALAMLDEIPLSATEALTRGEVDIQVATAKRYPRSIHQAVRSAITLATMSEDAARSCMYSLPRAGKPITGPSVRLAEMIASSWGHLRCETRITEEGPEYIVARGTAWDMQSNLLIAQEVRRRITNKEGKRFNADMIGVTANAAASIALRNAIFRVIPKSIVDQVYDAAHEVAVGNAKTIAEKRARTVDWLQKMGASTEMILQWLGYAGVDDITLQDLETLVGVGSRIKAGEIYVEEAFAVQVPEEEAKPTSALDAVKSAAKRGAGKSTEKTEGQMFPADPTTPSAVTE